MEIIHIVLTSGLELDVETAALDDIETVELIAAMNKGGNDAVYALPELLERFLGAAGKAALYEHLRNEKGRVPVSAVEAAVAEIFQLLAKENTSKK